MKRKFKRILAATFATALLIQSMSVYAQTDIESVDQPEVTVDAVEVEETEMQESEPAEASDITEFSEFGNDDINSETESAEPGADTGSDEFVSDDTDADTAADPEFADEADIHNYDYISNDDGTHTVICTDDDCEAEEKTEDCDYDEETGICVKCGYEKPVETEESEENPDQKETCAVTFFASDEIMEEYELYTVDVAVNSVMEVDIIPMVPEVDGYTFTGWDNDINAEIIEDTEFHALYEEIIEDAEEQETEEDEIEVTVSDIDDDVLTEANELVSNAYADYVVAGAFDLSVPEDTEFPVTITFDADVTVSDTVMILHYTGELWEEISPESVEDGSVTATFNSLSPVVVLKYEETESEELTFVEKRLVQTVNGVRISVSGEMPENAWLSVTAMEPSEKVIDGKAAIASYDITIMYGDGLEYEPDDFGREIHVSFSNVSTLALGEVAVQHNTDTGFEEMGTKEVSEGNDTISFNTDSFSEYVLTTATLTMTRGADYVSIPIVGKTGYIYHMELDGYTAFCIELGKHASSGDQYYYTDVFSNANALKVLDVFENGSSLTYETAQALVWLAIESDFTNDNITTVLQSLQCSSSTISTVISELASASGTDTWYVYTSVQGDEYQKVVTKFQLIDNTPVENDFCGIYIKVYLDGVATDAYPVTFQSCANTWTSSFGGNSVDEEITPTALGNGLYAITYEQLKNANLLSNLYGGTSDGNGTATYEMATVRGSFGFNIAGKSMGYPGSDLIAFSPYSLYNGSNINAEFSQIVNGTTWPLDTTYNYLQGETITSNFKKRLWNQKRDSVSGEVIENIYNPIVFPIFLSSISVRDTETDKILLDGGVFVRAGYYDSCKEYHEYGTSYVFNKSTIIDEGYIASSGDFATINQYALDLDIDLTMLTEEIQHSINSRYFSLGTSTYSYSVNDLLSYSYPYYYGVNRPIIHYIDGAVSNHTVTFDVNGGTPEYGSVTVADGEKVTKPLTVPLKTGKTFVSWQLDDEDYDFNTPVTQDITLVAKYSSVGYNITYDLDGGAMPTGVTNPTYYDMDTATFTINNPEKTGYTFKGWTGSNGTTPQTTVTVTQGTTGDLHYVANWEIIHNTVTFVDDSTIGSYRTGNLFPKNVTVDYGSSVTYPTEWVEHYNNGNTFDLVNGSRYFKFKGWQNVDTGEYIAEADIAHPSASGITSSSYAVTGNVTYQAMYDTYYGVIFTDGINRIAPETVANPANTVVSGENYYYKAGSVIDQPGSAYASAYWAKGNYPADISNITADMPLNLTRYGNTLTMGTSPVSYIAYYSMKFCNDDYVDSTNRGTTITEIYNVKDSIVAPPSNPTTAVTGSTDIFDKWVLKEAADLNGTQFKQQTCSMVYVATYKPAPTYNVVFVDYDGTEIDRQVCHMSDTVNIPESPSREGYRFKGWTPTVNTVCNGDATYTATYAELFTVKFVDFDSTVISEREYEAGNTVVVPTSPTRDGYTFAGWTPVVSSTCNGDATYMATYTAIPAPTQTPSSTPEPTPSEEPDDTPEPTPSDEPVAPEPTETPSEPPTPSPSVTPTPSATPVKTPEPRKPENTPTPKTPDDKPSTAPSVKPEVTPDVSPEIVEQPERAADLSEPLPTETTKRYDIEKFIAAVIGIAAATGFSLWALLMLLLFLFRKKNKVIGLYETDGKVTYVNGKGHKIKAEDLDDVQTVQELAEKVNAGEMSAEEFLEALYEYDVWTVFPPHTVAGVTIGEESLAMPKMNNSEVRNVYENISGDTTVNISNPDKGIDIEFALK